MCLTNLEKFTPCEVGYKVFEEEDGIYSGVYYKQKDIRDMQTKKIKYIQRAFTFFTPKKLP